MSTVEEMTLAFKESTQIFPDRSRLMIGGTEMAFHCDKFNTRICKNLEDVLGVEEGGELLRASAEQTTHAFLTQFLDDGDRKAQFEALSPQERLQTIFGIFKVLAYGALEIVELSEEKSVFRSASTYLSEGWRENQKRWRWVDREDPACHDIRGHLSAAMALAFDKPVGSYDLVETKCRAMGQDACEFVAEVI
jgi:hypothetical protein